ncbi:LysR family transcriptional regulator [Celeribacter halophilus]|uniref:DNA-binding transcriptional regulator, LysR family n=1 Tax=Celeribacter halophilus TaxID=576117 RepID=A0A1I3R078_9RHOB|nr:LysR family transcriptional regulator [Celeribacter halophilus]PZX13237.1 DNA-binding transcriptional LysR family regulator [Celeribacter halophilus]SFJ38696.1 DNA-binding transcriptional regulator, LysR family [Celeribacter halophilus]
MKSDLTLRELEVLRALMDHNTATAAAEALGLSQPAISRTLSQMEATLGRKLFLREGGRLLPTDEARKIDSELDVIFAAISRIETQSTDLPPSERPMYLATPPTIGHGFLPLVMAEFNRRFPRQKIVADIGSSDSLVTQVAEGRFDLALVDSEPNHPGVWAEAFRTSDLVCVMRRDNPLAERDVITPRDLDGQPFVAQTRRHTVRAAQDGVLAAANAHPDAIFEVGTVVLATQLVLQGAGVALINPFPTILRLDPALCARPFRPRVAMRTWFMTPASSRPSAAVLAFMKLVRETVASQKGYFE